MSLGDAAFTKRKNRVKFFRTIFQLLVLLGIITLLINAFFTLKRYRPFSVNEVAMADAGGLDTGFLALSYFGVDRKGGEQMLIGARILRDHLRALYDQGYVTISQQDIVDYYEKGQPLPKRSLFLMFEDGRRDTAIFAQPILEDFNFAGNMMTYAENFTRSDAAFLHPDELKELEDTMYWQLGTNGYRLAFINIFDRYDTYIGELDPLRFSMMRPALSRRYNHYLMDFIRDKHGLPKESAGRMRRRINYDYERLGELYQEGLGYVPGLYVIMHANTGAFGNHPLVSQINRQWIQRMFQMNFNREGYCFNQRNSSIYDLTRMQPQPDWSVNHLLMRIKYDINQPVAFVAGDAARHADWEVLEGAAEMHGEEYIITSLPEGRGMARLRGSGGFSDLHLRVELRGNRHGEQGIYLRANDDLSRFIRVRLGNGEVVVTEKNGGSETELYREKLIKFFGIAPISVEEARRAAEVLELKTFARYAESPLQAKEYSARMLAREAEAAASVDDGAPYDEEVTERLLKPIQPVRISLEKDKLAVKIGETPLPDIKVSNLASGSLYLEAGWSEKEVWNQRNLADDVYDGRFHKLMVTADAKGDTVLYTTEYYGWEKIKARGQEIWDDVLIWFMKNL